ncbi:hypothetical protein BJ998_003644 [Kutzneria kofuensis]|uniref:Uncharacterized protein n=1 Tax=Kutzneria kofuensis TaxID=103725 RepID=A0A7W9NHT8_9PSEU|nr:hypothetical protein [Kutzneria kofuensis]MBB5892448.1 hypothetical protein [Kutzneria kofuensis]
MVKVRDIAFVAAPALLGGYGVVRLLSGHGPGIGWTAGHLLFLAGLMLFVPVMLTLGDRPGPAPVVAAVGLLGVTASVAQVVIDIVAGVVASDRAGMNALFEQVQSVPGLLPGVYVIGPALFYLCLITLAVLNWRELGWWSPVLLAVGTGLTLFSLNLIPVAAVCFLFAIGPYGVRRTDRRLTGAAQ